MNDWVLSPEVFIGVVAEVCEHTAVLHVMAVNDDVVADAHTYS